MERLHDYTGRRERARQARDQVVGVAEELFLSRGYAATTVAAIAAQAQVSVETIYKGFGGKPGLVRAIIEKGLAGRGPVPAEQRSDRIRDTEPDPRRILTAWGEFVAEIYADAPDANDNPKHATREEKRVNASTLLHVKMAQGGGQAIRIRPAQ